VATGQHKATGAGANRSSRVTLDANLDIASAGKLHSKLMKSVNRGVNVNLYAARVVKIDTAALQLLFACVKQVRDNGNTVNWHEPSEALLSSAALTGLSEYLGLCEFQI